MPWAAQQVHGAPAIYVAREVLMAAASVAFEGGRALRAGRRIHRGFIVGAILTALAVAGSYSLYQSRPVVERGVVVATRDVPRGAVLGPGDFTTRSTPIDDGLYASLLHPGQETPLVGRAAPENLYAGVPIAIAQVAPQEEVAADQTLASLPVPPDTVPLQKGDWVMVWGSSKDGRTSLILDGVQVVDIVSESSSRTAGGVGQDRTPHLVSVNLALQPAQAQALLDARHAGDINVTRLPASAVQAQGLARQGAAPPLQASAP